jgi:hypothetical protein
MCLGVTHTPKEIINRLLLSLSQEVVCLNGVHISPEIIIMLPGRVNRVPPADDKTDDGTFSALWDNDTR